MKVLFLCAGNSCLSQMAEGWARALRGVVTEPYSAGIEDPPRLQQDLPEGESKLGVYRRVRMRFVIS